jgi:hypothetical protein
MVLVSSLTMISSGSVFGLGWPNTVWRLCEENQSQAHLYQWILCCAFHNVRLSITGIFRLEGSNFQFADKTTGLTRRPSSLSVS